MRKPALIALLISLSDTTLSTVQAAEEWKVGIKVLEVQSRVNGDVYFRVNAPISSTPPSPLTPCTNTWISIPKTLTVTNQTIPDGYLARLQASLQSAMARNAKVNIIIETNWGCYWGTYPIAAAVSEEQQ